jgi:preprotein translocase subunit SecB
MTGTPQTTRPTIFLRAQYIKDLSFENPRAPASLFTLKEPPQIEVSVNLGAQRLDEHVFEVALQIGVRALVDKATVFLTDLVYAGVIEMQNIPEEQIEPTLFIQGAQMIYPFARRVISDVTRDGGFPPVALEPLDFAAMYAEQRQKASA